MAKIIQLIEHMIIELTAIQSSTFFPLDKDEKFLIPRLISVGKDDSIRISRKIDDDIAVVANQLYTSTAVQNS